MSLARVDVAVRDKVHPALVAWLEKSLYGHEVASLPTFWIRDLNELHPFTSL